MKCVYVYNPTSGRQKSVKMRQYIISRLKEGFSEVEIKPTQKAGDAVDFARECCGKADVLVVSGGDGTINEVINGIANQPNRPKIAYIPTGTTNDLAHSLKIPKNVKKAMDIILDGNTTTHDIFRVNEKYGIYVCGFGVFTGTSYNASQKSKKAFGRLAYFKSALSEFFSSKAIKLQLDFEGGSLNGKYALGLAVNSRYVAGYKINKMACCNDGFVNLILIKNNKKRKHVTLLAILRIFRLFVFGMRSLKDGKNCSILKLKKFKITLPEKTIINLDGEAGTKGSFDFEVLEKHVEIFVKK